MLWEMFIFMDELATQIFPSPAMLTSQFVKASTQLSWPSLTQHFKTCFTVVILGGVVTIMERVPRWTETGTSTWLATHNPPIFRLHPELTKPLSGEPLIYLSPNSTKRPF